MGNTNQKKKTVIQHIKTAWEYGDKTVSGAIAGKIIGKGIGGAVAGASIAAIGKGLYDLAGDPEVMAATRKRERDRMREAQERNEAAFQENMREKAESDRRKTQADKERTARFQPPATPPGQDRDALRGRPKIVIPD